MLVEEIMQRNVVTLPPTASIATAMKLLQEHRIRHIPIVDEHDNVIGIVSDRDVLDACSSIYVVEDHLLLHQNIPAATTARVTTIEPLDFVTELAGIIYEEEVFILFEGGNEQLIGVICEEVKAY